MNPDKPKDPAHEKVRVDLPEPFVDARGSIQPLFDDDIKSAQVISSKAGSVRANHYHKTDYHYMYVVSGAFDYYYRPTGSSEEPKRLRVGAGEIVFTPPMVDHAVRYVEDTTFVNFAGRRRDQGSYENDLVRIQLIPTD